MAKDYKDLRTVSTDEGMEFDTLNPTVLSEAEVARLIGDLALWLYTRTSKASLRAKIEELEKELTQANTEIRILTRRGQS